MISWDCRYVQSGQGIKFIITHQISERYTNCYVRVHGSRCQNVNGLDTVGIDFIDKYTSALTNLVVINTPIIMFFHLYFLYWTTNSIDRSVQTMSYTKISVGYTLLKNMESVESYLRYEGIKTPLLE